MREQLIIFLQKIKENPNLANLGETAARSGIIEPILQILGWTTSAISDEVVVEYVVEGRRVDYCLRPNKSIEVFLEAKKPSEDLKRHQDQLLEYSFRHGVRLAVLSSGIVWFFYLPLKEGKWENRRFYTIDIISQDSVEAASRFIDFLSKENIATGNAIKNAEQLLEGKRKQEIIEDTLPEAWNKIITEPDSLLVDLLAEVTRKLCGVQPERDQIIDFFIRYSDSFQLLPEDDLPEEQESIKVIRARKNISDLSQPPDKISQEELIPYILQAIENHGGGAEKKIVQEEVYKKLKGKFDQPWYQELTTKYNIPRWQHTVAWARNLAKDRGFIKQPIKKEDRGYWEIADLGRKFLTGS